MRRSVGFSSNWAPRPGHKSDPERSLEADGADGAERKMMPLFALFRQESKISLWVIAGTCALAGLSSSVILVIANEAAMVASATGQIQGRLFFLFVLAASIHFVAQRFALNTVGAEVERVLHQTRLRIVNRIREADLQTAETINSSRVSEVVTRDTQVISQSTIGLVMGLQACALVLTGVIYLYFVSKWALLLVTLVVLGALPTYRGTARETRRLAHESLDYENHFFDGVSHVLDGFKELKMSRRRSDALQAEIARRSLLAADSKAELRVKIGSEILVTQLAHFLLVAAAVFLLPSLGPQFSANVFQLLTAVLFLFGPLGSVVGAAAAVAEANAAVERIGAIETMLEQAPIPSGGAAEQFEPLVTFSEIRLEGATFHYEEEARAQLEGGVDGFQLGPIDISIKQGEVLFITGGNGSGKSTLLNLLVGLTSPVQGRLVVDGQEVGRSSVEAYRHLFSTVFSDYHLFDRLYGSDAPTSAVTDLLLDMELQKKTRFSDGGFENLNLSTGQRKRLAFIVGILEDRPVYVFDEWAAEQDPEFRAKFYRTIIPQLKKSGKTVIAITHDDRYFDAADRWLKLEEGRLVEA